MVAILQTNQQLRKKIKLKRQILTNSQRNISEKRLSRQFASLIPSLKTNKVASYIACNGEVSSKYIEKSLTHSDFYLPRITNFHNKKMSFYKAKNRLIQNRYKIYEPQAIGPPTQLSTVDIIFVPLVAFDRQGNRLGMGGGFYDRALEFKQHQTGLQRPILIGLAHHFQEVDLLSPQPWDIPLDVIITDRELIKLTI